MEAKMMIVLIGLAICAAADAGHVLFTKIKGNIYVETDPQQYAVFGPIMDKDGIRVIAVDGEDHFTLTSKCAKEWRDLTEVGQDQLEAYGDIRMKSIQLFFSGLSKINFSAHSFAWLISFDREQKLSSIDRLDADTLVYTSKYLPKKLTKVFISGNIAVFVHHDGFVSMRTMNCLYPNEKLLVEGLRLINSDGGAPSPSSREVDRSIRKQFKKHPINEPEFYFEQSMKRHTFKSRPGMFQLPAPSINRTI